MHAQVASCVPVAGGPAWEQPAAYDIQLMCIDLQVFHVMFEVSDTGS